MSQSDNEDIINWLENHLSISQNATWMKYWAFICTHYLFMCCEWKFYYQNPDYQCAFLSHLKVNKEKLTGAGFEPATSWIPYRRSTNWAIQPYVGGVPNSQLSLFVWQSEAMKPRTYRYIPRIILSILAAMLQPDCDSDSLSHIATVKVYLTIFHCSRWCAA